MGGTGLTDPDYSGEGGRRSRIRTAGVGRRAGKPTAPQPGLTPVPSLPQVRGVPARSPPPTPPPRPSPPEGYRSAAGRQRPRPKRGLKGAPSRASDDSGSRSATALRAPGLQASILHHSAASPPAAVASLMAAPASSSSSLHSVSQASRHGRGRVGRGSPGSRAAAMVAVAAAALTLPGTSGGGGSGPADAAAILATDRRRVLGDGNQGAGAGRGYAPAANRRRGRDQASRESSLRSSPDLRGVLAPGSGSPCYLVLRMLSWGC